MFFVFKDINMRSPAVFGQRAAWRVIQLGSGRCKPRLDVRGLYPLGAGG